MTRIVFVRKLRKFLTVIVIAIIVLSLPEFAARWYVAQRPLPTYLTRRDFLLSRPVPFKDADYWSPEFIDESLDISNWDYFTKEYPFPADRSGRWVNYRDGSRVTTNQPSIWQHTIWMFGSSGLYGFGVPDEDTIPSDLQALYNKVPGNYRVMDMGMSAAVAQQEVARLQVVPLKAGDIVVFYDGTVDLESIVMALTRRFDKEQSILCDKLALVYMICSANEQTFFEHLATESEPKREMSSLIDEYRGAIEDAKTYSEQQGAIFYHVMQPQLWSRSLSSYEQTVNDNLSLVPPFADKVYTVVWQDMHLAYTVDFTHILDDLRGQGVEVFLDSDHINQLGTKVVAEALYAALLPSF